MLSVDKPLSQPGPTRPRVNARQAVNMVEQLLLGAVAQSSTGDNSCMFGYCLSASI